MATERQKRYIYYVEGSAARQLSVADSRKKLLKKPLLFLQRQRVVYVDPLAYTGIVTAALMLILMTVGWFQLQRAEAENVQLESYVQTLEQCYAEKKLAYAEAYDMEAVERTALSLGMIPVEEVEHVTIRVQPPVQASEQSAWEQFTNSLAGIFA